MGYLDDYLLGYADLDFRHRLAMCIAEQAKIYVNDGRPEFYRLAKAAIDDNVAVTDKFIPVVATQPSMTDQNTDEDILAAVQTLWPVVGAGYVTTA